MNSSLEILEARIAPATLAGTNTVTYTDVDGDAVTVKTTAGAFVLATHFTFVPSGAGEQLQMLDLGADAAFTGASLTLTAKPGANGDGFVNVGAIKAQVDLGKVTLDGDLGVIEAGGGGSTALKSLTVQSMGRFGTETQGGGALVSTINGTLASFTSKTDVQDVDFIVNGDLSKLAIGGSLLGGAADFAGRLVITGNLGATKIGRDVRGSGGASSGSIDAGAAITSLTIGGSVVGGAGDNSARISSGTTMGKVLVTGHVVGRSGIESGVIHAGGALAGVTINGSVFGGTGATSGSISSDASIGPIKVKFSVQGGAGDHSGEVFSGGTLGAVTLGGSLTGGAGLFSGRIAATGDTAAIKIAGDVRGGAGENSGVIESDGAIKSATISGSLIGGPASFTGTLFGAVSIGSVTITGDVTGGDSEFDGVTVEGTGAVRGGRLPAVTIGGSLVAGAIRSLTGTLAASGVILATDDIGKLTIKGSVLGSADVAAQIIARGQPALAANATTDVAIKSIAIGGSVDRAIIDAGFGLNADAQIGSVSVTGDWSRSSIAAGIDPVNGLFGGIDDALIADADDRPGISSRIGSILIKGQALGAPDGTGEFGFVAEQIGSMKIGKGTVPLTANDDVLAIGATGDLMLREI